MFVRVISIGWRRRLEVLGHVLAVLIWVQVVPFFVKVGKRSRLAFVLLGVWHLGMGMILARDEGMDGVGLFKGGVLISWFWVDGVIPSSTLLMPCQQRLYLVPVDWRHCVALAKNIPSVVMNPGYWGPFHSTIRRNPKRCKNSAYHYPRRLLPTTYATSISY